MYLRGSVPEPSKYGATKKMTILTNHKRERESKNLPTQNRTMIGQKRVSGNQEEIWFKTSKTSLQLCKYYNPVTGRLTVPY